MLILQNMQQVYRVYGMVGAVIGSPREYDFLDLPFVDGIKGDPDVLFPSISIRDILHRLKRGQIRCFPTVGTARDLPNDFIDVGY